jgi:hypothetical protein
MAHATHTDDASVRGAGALGGFSPDAANDDLAETLDTEHLLVRRIIVSVVIAVPVAVVVMTGLVTLALTADHVRLEGPLVMAAAVGVLVGVFFGAWAGFVGTTHAFERLDASHETHDPTDTPA